MLTDEQRKFLIDLQEELNTQDTVGQADPRFWVVRHKVATAVPEGFGEDYYSMVRDGESMRVEVEDVEKARDIAEFLGEEVDLVPMRYEERNASDTMFLTLRECREHIERNSYHYCHPHPYAMTAWRSPQVKRLIEILKSADWSDE